LLSLTTIFLFAVGDFGLATSSLAAVDSENLAPKGAAIEPDMTLGSYVHKSLLHLAGVTPDT
jgi:hypothetical protein